MSKPNESHETVLQEAQRLVYGDRGRDYGHPTEDYTRTVRIFNAMTGHNLSPMEGMLFMVAVKLSRFKNKATRDCLVDAAGYLECIARHLHLDP